VFHKPTFITEKTINILLTLQNLAPLHNPFNLKGIHLARTAFPKAKHVAVFDTGFFHHLPQYAHQYAIPDFFYEKYGIKKFGFHGISHEYALISAAERLRKNPAELNLITCHLGGGSSITAIKKGIAIDTSMGFTPLDGIPMGTRPGSLDPGVILELLMNKKYKLSPEKLFYVLNHSSGLKGICGKDDFRDILALRAKNKAARLAFDLFIYHIQKQIGAFYAVLGSVSAVVFTGSIGSGKSITRNAVIKKLPFLKTIPILSIKTDEEYMIAKKIIAL
jgi:acetate kinase